MTGDAARVSVVVPTRNRAGLLPRLLAALDALEPPDSAGYEVIVVDDGSADATPGILAEWSGAGRRSIRLDVAGGSYAARNAGWRAAQGGIIAFTDDDCLPEHGWLAGLVGALREPDFVAVQGIILTDRAGITPFTHQIEQTKPGPPFRTANMAYRREVLEELGGFDDRFRWYADNVLGLRAARYGRIAFAPDAVVLHPPRPREWRDRATWRARFAADAAHRRILQELSAEPVTLPVRALPVVLWIARPLLKQSRAHLRYFLRHPREYLQGIGPMLTEKREMFLAMADFWGIRPDRDNPRYPLRGRWLPSGRRHSRRGKPPWLPLVRWRTKGGSPATRYPAPPLPQLPDEPCVSVVVVTRDRPNLLAGTLAALRSQTWQNRDIVVVDNGESPQTEEVAGAAGARYIPAADLTLGAARQRGVEAAGGEVVAFTDDDCVPEAAWLESIVSAFQSRPELWGAQGRTEAEGGKVGSHAVRIAGPDLLFQTCNMAYRREALDASGGFDPRFAGWFEDTDLGARVHDLGPIDFVGDAVVTHRAVMRRPLDRERWALLLQDEKRLAERHPDFYRRVRGPGLLTTVIVRWLVGSPLKALAREMPKGLRDPKGYGRLAGQLLRERVELMRALLSLS